jgi:hypothetical protein
MTFWKLFFATNVTSSEQIPKDVSLLEISNNYAVTIVKLGRKSTWMTLICPRRRHRVFPSRILTQFLRGWQTWIPPLSWCCLDSVSQRLANMYPSIVVMLSCFPVYSNAAIFCYKIETFSKNIYVFPAALQMCVICDFLKFFQSMFRCFGTTYWKISSYQLMNA